MTIIIILLFQEAATFSGQPLFQREYVFTVSTSSEQLILLINQFDKTGHFFQQFFQSSFFFKVKLPPSSFFLRVDSSLLQLIFQTSYFFGGRICFTEDLLFGSSYLFRAVPFLWLLLFWNIYFLTVNNQLLFFSKQLFFRQSKRSTLQLLLENRQLSRTDNFSEQLLLRLKNFFRIKISTEKLLFLCRHFQTVSNFSRHIYYDQNYLFEKVFFQWSFFFGRGTFSEGLLFHNIIVQTRYLFTGPLTFHNCMSYLLASN